MADDLKKLKAENERLTAENAELKQQLDYTREQFVRLMSRNLDLSDRIEGDLEFRRRVDVVRELIEMNMERLRNADLRDDAQLMAIVETEVEGQRLHLNPNSTPQHWQSLSASARNGSKDSSATNQCTAHLRAISTISG
jgi:predicted RNase H-like nuclease (RuvC/YqgF family)